MGDEQLSTREEAFEQRVGNFSRRYNAVLVRYFTKRGIEPQDAADLTQEVFVRITSRGNLDGVENPEGYIFAISANVLMDYFRRRKVRSEHFRQSRFEEPAQDFSPERLAEGREELEAVMAALHSMPERMRNIFILARLENLPRAEIAVRLGISKSLVEKQLAQAVACLAEQRSRLA